MVPRIVTAREWRKLSHGIEQRVRALNAFLHDIYHRQEIVRSGRLRAGCGGGSADRRRADVGDL